MQHIACPFPCCFILGFPLCCSSPDEPMVRLQHKVSSSLKQALEKLKLSENAAETKGELLTLSSLFSVLLFLFFFFSPSLLWTTIHVLFQ